MADGVTHVRAAPPEGAAPARAAQVAATFAGGAAGALARLALVQGIPAAAWPWATFIANVAGAFLLGAVAVWREDRHPLDVPRALAGTGFCGALTTFSTLQLEVVGMLESGRAGLAAAYVVAGVLVGLGAVHVGSAVVRGVRP